jgi:phosphoadenosine phosphosulfate reductase
MSVQRFSTAATQRALLAAGQSATQQLQSVVANYPARTVFATRFSLEDQVLSHLIFKNDLSVRVFTLTGGDQHRILVESVEFFNANIEVSFRQARLGTAAFAQQHPAVAVDNAATPATAPLTQLLQGHHLLISSLRKDQLARQQQHPTQLEWDEANQRAIFYPLFDWTEQQVREYVAQFGLPHQPVGAVALSLSEAAEQQPIQVARNAQRA